MDIEEAGRRIHELTVQADRYLERKHTPSTAVLDRLDLAGLRLKVAILRGQVGIARKAAEFDHENDGWGGQF